MNSRRSSALIGAAALAAIVAVVYFLALYLGGAFLPGYEVTAHFARAGQLLRSGSDVKLRGVLVGSVSTIEVERRTGKARIGLRLFEEHEVPENVEAAVRAKTLFGEKYIDVDLTDTDEQDGPFFEAGDEFAAGNTVSLTG